MRDINREKGRKKKQKTRRRLCAAVLLLNGLFTTSPRLFYAAVRAECAPSGYKMMDNTRQSGRCGGGIALM